MKNDVIEKEASKKLDKKNNKRKKKKGFTLIELLAVIIILGVLMIIAIPSVTKYIDESKKNGYVSTARNITIGVRNIIHSGSLNVDDKDTTYYIEGKCINTDNKYSSPYGEFEKAYVVVVATEDGHDYYWMSVDETGTGVKNLIKLDDLESKKIESDISVSDITPTIGIDRRNKIVVVGGENCTKSEPVEAEKMLSGTTGRVKDVCPETYTQTIYWALQDTNSDGKNDKLIFSDSEVNGNLSGNFPGNTVFSEYNLPPWIGVENPSQTSNLSYYVSNVEVVGQVAPTSVDFLLACVGIDIETFSADLNNIETCHVTSMRGTFTGAGLHTNSVYIDIRDWDTSKVTSMEGTFSGTGSYSPVVKIDGIENLNTSNITNMEGAFISMAAGASTFSLNLSKWNTSNVTNMDSMFSYVGADANSFNLNVSNWDTSKVTNMNRMFFGTAMEASSFNLNLSSWDTSNVTNMDSMFAYAGEYSSNVNLNLNGWDTSKVTNMHQMFYAVGYEASTVNIDVSSFNTSKVTNMSAIFAFIGPSAQSFSIKIPSTNGESISNTTSRIYGKTTSVYGSAPNGKLFTLATTN